MNKYLGEFFVNLSSGLILKYIDEGLTEENIILFCMMFVIGGLIYLYNNNKVGGIMSIKIEENYFCEYQYADMSGTIVGNLEEVILGKVILKSRGKLFILPIEGVKILCPLNKF